MRTAKVTLNEVEVEIKERRARENAAWLKKTLEGPVKGVVEKLAGAMAAGIDQPDQVTQAMTATTEVLGGVFDLVLDLLKEYAPEHEKDFEACYASEAVAAFVEVVKLALPFQSLLQLFKALKNLG